MIQILPGPAERLPTFCREKGLQSPAPLRGYTACQGDCSLGWCLVAQGEPCLVLGVEAEDSLLADGLLRAALFPLDEGGARQYRFAATSPQDAGSFRSFLPPAARRRKRDER